MAKAFEEHGTAEISLAGLATAAVQGIAAASRAAASGARSGLSKLAFEVPSRLDLLQRGWRVECRVVLS
jgi:hypothetical protein